MSLTHFVVPPIARQEHCGFLVHILTYRQFAFRARSDRPLFNTDALPPGLTYGTLGSSHHLDAPLDIANEYLPRSPLLLNSGGEGSPPAVPPALPPEWDDSSDGGYLSDHDDDGVYRGLGGGSAGVGTYGSIDGSGAYVFGNALGSGGDGGDAANGGQASTSGADGGLEGVDGIGEPVPRTRRERRRRRRQLRGRGRAGAGGGGGEFDSATDGSESEDSGFGFGGGFGGFGEFVSVGGESDGGTETGVYSRPLREPTGSGGGEGGDGDGGSGDGGAGGAGQHVIN